MNIKLYYNSSDNRVIGKTLNNELNIEGTIKNSYDSNSITIPFNKDNINTNILEFNYANFDGKYYFLSNARYVAQGIVSFDFELDYLETYKLAIANQVALLDRSESHFNRYLNDETLRSKTYKRVQTKKFPSGFQTFGNPVLVTVNS